MSDPRSNFHNFAPPGPVTKAFLLDTTTEVRSLMGPVGGGKTVTCIFDALTNAARMPMCLDGQIHYRLAVIGMTYGQIERNLYPTWFDWLPKTGGEWTDGEWAGGGGRFGEQKLRFEILRGNRRVVVNFTAIFAAIGDNAVDQFMRGFEPTAWYLYEMDLLPDTVLREALGRLGRYPSVRMLPPGVTYRKYVIADYNAPDIDSWVVKNFDTERIDGYRQYRQPSGRSPKAENLQNLPPNFYADKVRLNASNPNWIKRMVDNEYAPNPQGQPVYGDEYSDDRHLSPIDIPYLPGVPIRLGIDQGLRNPACVITQRHPNGQKRVLGEVAPGRVGTKAFAAAIRLEVGKVAPGAVIGGAHCDPAGFSGTVAEDGQLGFADTLEIELNTTILPTDTNEIDVRLDAVRDELKASIDAHTPALLISRRCTVLRKAFASHYRYRKSIVGGQERLSPKPEKNSPWADLMNALEYDLLGEKGMYGVVSSGAGGRQARAATGKVVQIQNVTDLHG